MSDASPISYTNPARPNQLTTQTLNTARAGATGRGPPSSAGDLPAAQQDPSQAPSHCRVENSTLVVCVPGLPANHAAVMGPGIPSPCMAVWRGRHARADMHCLKGQTCTRDTCVYQCLWQPLHWLLPAIMIQLDSARNFIWNHIWSLNHMYDTLLSCICRRYFTVIWFHTQFHKMVSCFCDCVDFTSCLMKSYEFYEIMQTQYSRCESICFNTETIVSIMHL